jgi:DNA invertase Pin-like site-specific DNA recombinase
MALGYLRVSTDEQVASGAGLDGQRLSIENRAAMQGLHIPEDGWYVDDGVSGTTPPEEREELSKALQALQQGPASVFLFMRVDRLARKVRDLIDMRDRAETEGWTLAAADGSVDLTTPHGRTLFTMQGAFAELERDLIAARTREALAALRAQGVRLGRPSVLPLEVVARILAERSAGDKSWAAIAELLNAEGVPTAHGGVRWWPATVRKVALGQDAMKLTA